MSQHNQPTDAPPEWLYAQILKDGSVASYERDPREVHDNGKPVYVYHLTAPTGDTAPTTAAIHAAAREIVQKISDAAIELAFVRHELTTTEYEAEEHAGVEEGVEAFKVLVEEVKADVLACLTGDEEGCLDPEDVDYDNELEWTIRRISRHLAADSADAHVSARTRLIRQQQRSGAPEVTAVMVSPAPVGVAIDDIWSTFPNIHLRVLTAEKGSVEIQICDCGMSGQCRPQAWARIEKHNRERLAKAIAGDSVAADSATAVECPHLHQTFPDTPAINECLDCGEFVVPTVKAVPHSATDRAELIPEKPCDYCNLIDCVCSDFDVSPEMGAKG